MTPPDRPRGPDLHELFGLFPESDDLPVAVEPIAADDVPEPYRGLLVHHHHMTVTVEAFHGDRVRTRVLALRQEGLSYARKILLVTEGGGRVVQFGIVRVNLAFVNATVRAGIIRAQKPFGRVLIDNDVLRRIEPTAYLRLTPSPPWLTWFGMPASAPLYGRLALIHCDGRPAVELLEVVAP
jgi:hypothetical protein